MAINDVLTTLTARRDRFRELLAVKSVEVAADASLLQCLDALAAYFGVAVGDPEDLYPANRLPCGFITLNIPEIQSDEDLEVKKLTPVLGYNGEYHALPEERYFYHYDSGSRFRMDVSSCVGQVYIYWMRSYDYDPSNADVQYAAYKSSVQFDGYHSPQYYKRPSHDGTLKLIVDGQEAPLEVYHNGRWMTAPEEGLSAEYAGDYIRLIPDDLATHTAYWTAGDGLNSDEFTYMT